MTIFVRCNCGRGLNLADDLRGKRIKCPECSAILTVKDEGTTGGSSAPGAGSKSTPNPSATAGSTSTTERAASPKPPAIPTAPKSPPKPRTSRPEPKAAARKSSTRASDNLDWIEPEPEDYDDPFAPAMAPQRSTARSRPRTKSSVPWLPIFGGLGGIAFVAVIVVLAIKFLGGGATPESAFGPATAIGLPGASTPPIPSKPALNQQVGNGVMTGLTSFQSPGSPGGSTQLQVYMPPGNHAQRSLGCILVAPAGTNLLMGNMIDDSSYHDETLPYAEAGFLTIKYSIDGGIADVDNANDAQMVDAYRQFRDARYGVTNTSRAIDFALSYAEVDPNRIYVAGHSSAGTLALLAAEHDPRVKGCIAYAPCADVESFHADLHSDFFVRQVFRDIKFVSKDSSPTTYQSRLNCPVFLFQAADDSVVSVTETRQFAEQVRAHNPQVEYAEVPSGEHYDSMIQQGIPRAVLWLMKLTR
ncbi:MAG: prolyl oligopeptidase family serine peptidase [Planctomyces sp.]|nr:prolyl oligopeptidase family serine peptidase [Planctomyces sp.]